MSQLATTQQIIEDAKAGKMFILVDDEDRENEGDLVIPAEHADAEAINFMATHGRGLICLALTKDRTDALGLELMPPRNQSRLQTAFTVSIEAAEGVTTGISAADRATTIQAAIDAKNGKEAIVTPGHIFPLIARDGGVLVRSGHTEASVDIAKLAGKNPSGVICEIMKKDGTMARLPDLLEFAEKHGLHVGSIADLIAYRKQHESLIERVLETTFDSYWGGEFKMIIYRSKTQYAEHIALIKGEINPEKPTLVRMHALDVLTDVLADKSKGRTKQRSMEMIAEEGGVLVLLREPSPTSLSDRVRRRMGEDVPRRDEELRDYGIGAQILRDLGVRDMTLLTHNPKPVVGLEGYDLHIVDYRKPV